MSKARRIDYYPDEYIAGVGNVLKAAEQGVYWMICSLIMSEGGPIKEDAGRIASLCKMRRTDAAKTIEALVTEHKKLSRTEDGRLSQRRAEEELEKVSTRIEQARENGTRGGRPKKNPAQDPRPDGGEVASNLQQTCNETAPNLHQTRNETAPEPHQPDEITQQNQRDAKPEGFSGEKLTINHQPPTINTSTSSSSRPSPSPEDDDATKLALNYRNTILDKFPDDEKAALSSGLSLMSLKPQFAEWLLAGEEVADLELAIGEVVGSWHGAEAPFSFAPIRNALDRRRRVSERARGEAQANRDPMDAVSAALKSKGYDIDFSIWSGLKRADLDGRFQGMKPLDIAEQLWAEYREFCKEDAA